MARTGKKIISEEIRPEKGVRIEVDRFCISGLESEDVVSIIKKLIEADSKKKDCENK